MKMSPTCAREKRTGQDSLINVMASTELICTKICMGGVVLDIMTCAKFQSEIFRGYISIMDQMCNFPVDYCMKL